MCLRYQGIGSFFALFQQALLTFLKLTRRMNLKNDNFLQKYNKWILWANNDRPSRRVYFRGGKNILRMAENLLFL